MPQLKISGVKGLVQETSSVTGVNRIGIDNATVLSTGPGKWKIQEVITLPDPMTNAKVAGTGSYSIPQGAILLQASLVVLTIGAGGAGNGINVACGAAGTAVGGNAVVTVEFLGDGATGEIPAGDIAIGTGATAGQTAQANLGPVALAAGAVATVYVNDAGDNSAVLGTSPQVLLTIEYAGVAPTAL